MQLQLTKFRYYNHEEEQICKYIEDIILNSDIPEYKQEKHMFFSNHRYVLNIIAKLGFQSNADVLSLYYGLNDGVNRTYGEIAGRYNISREYVRQILKKAFNILLNPVIIRCCAHLNDSEIEAIAGDCEQIDVNRLEGIYKQWLQAREWKKLSDEEKEADAILDNILQTGLGRLSVILDSRNETSNSYTNVLDLLKVEEEMLKNEKNVELIDQIHAWGLHFCYEFEYEEEWLNKCRSGIIAFGIQNFKDLLEVITTNEAYFMELLKKPLLELGLPNRAFNSLKLHGVSTVGGLVQLTKRDCLEMPNMGNVAIKTIVSQLQKLGLDLRPENMNVGLWMELLSQTHNGTHDEKCVKTFQADKISGHNKMKLMTNGIESLGLSSRSYNLLGRLGILTIKDLVSKSENELSSLKGVGTNLIVEVIEKLIALNLYLRPEHRDADEWLTCLVEGDSKTQEQGCDVTEKRGNGILWKMISKNLEIQDDWSIQQIPENYRRAYALGAGLEAENQTKNLAKERLFVRAIINQYNRSVCKVTLDGHLKPTSKQVAHPTEEDSLEAISNNIEIIATLDPKFIKRYDTQIKTMILRSGAIDAAKKGYLISFVNNVTTVSY